MASFSVLIRISWLQTCPWTLPAIWLVEGGELWANERPPGILAWQWRRAASLENSRERQPDRQVGTSRNNPLCVVSPICQFSVSWVFNYSARQECEGGYWLVSWCALIFIWPFLFLCLSGLRVSFGSQWSSRVITVEKCHVRLICSLKLYDAQNVQILWWLRGRWKRWLVNEDIIFGVKNT